MAHIDGRAPEAAVDLYHTAYIFIPHRPQDESATNPCATYSLIITQYNFLCHYSTQWFCFDEPFGSQFLSVIELERKTQYCHWSALKECTVLNNDFKLTSSASKGCFLLCYSAMMLLWWHSNRLRSSGVLKISLQTCYLSGSLSYFYIWWYSWSLPVIPTGLVSSLNQLGSQR